MDTLFAKQLADDATQDGLLRRNVGEMLANVEIDGTNRSHLRQMDAIVAPECTRTPSHVCRRPLVQLIDPLDPSYAGRRRTFDDGPVLG